MYLLRNIQKMSGDNLQSLVTELQEQASTYGFFELEKEFVIAVSCNKNIMQELLTRYSLDVPLTSNIQRTMKKRKAKQTAS